MRSQAAIAGTTGGAQGASKIPERSPIAIDQPFGYSSVGKHYNYY